MKAKILLCLGAVLLIASCVHTTRLSVRTMEFDEGIRSLSINLADQLENSTIGNKFNKIIADTMSGNIQLKKIVIDPFIDAESGYPVKANSRIVSIVSNEMKKRFAVTGEMYPENLEISEFVLNGMVSIDKDGDKQETRYKVSATVFEKESGKVLASGTVYLSSFDTSPRDLYRDSPVFMKGKSYDDFTASVQKQANETVDQHYRDHLKVKALLVKGDRYYEQKDFKKSLDYYNQVAEGPAGSRMEVYNGQFTNLIKQGKMDKAEDIFAKLSHASIAETGQITNKITFGPNSVTPVEGKKKLYSLYIRQIAKLVASMPACKVKIIGHSSRTGSDGYNDKLSKQRAQWVQSQMISITPQIGERSMTEGRGFHDNIVGTGADNITDEIDRRVEFIFDKCSM